MVTQVHSTTPRSQPGTLRRRDILRGMTVGAALLASPFAFSRQAAAHGNDDEGRLPRTISQAARLIRSSGLLQLK
jgi:hypothetical protein